jgi:hypothetical protein
MRPNFDHPMDSGTCVKHTHAKQVAKCVDPIPALLTCAVCPNCGNRVATHDGDERLPGGGTMLPQCPACRVLTKRVRYLREMK